MRKGNKKKLLSPVAPLFESAPLQERMRKYIKYFTYRSFYLQLLLWQLQSKGLEQLISPILE